MVHKLQKALAVGCILAGLAATLSCGKNSNHYLYATTSGSSQIAVFRADPYSGVLTQLSQSPYTVGNGATSAVIHPSGKYLYVANPGQNENDVSLFDLNSDGTITEVTPRMPTGAGPSTLAMDPGGAYLYVADVSSEDIYVFSISSSNGTLAPVTGANPFPINAVPQAMALSPKGNYLFVSAPGPQNGLIASYSLSAGVPTFVGVTTVPKVNPQGMVIDPSGSYLYSANTTANSISIYCIAPASSCSGATPGTLKEVAGSPLADTNKAPTSLIVDSKGAYLYVANQGSNNISTYSITSGTGFPVAVVDSPFASESSPNFLALDPSGNYLYVGNSGSSAGVESFGVSSGSLNAIKTYSVASSPTSIAVVR